MKPQHILINRLIKEGVIDHPIIKIKCVGNVTFNSLTTRVELWGIRGDISSDYYMTRYVRCILLIFGLPDSIYSVYDNEITGGE